MIARFLRFIGWLPALEVKPRGGVSASSDDPYRDGLAKAIEYEAGGGHHFGVDREDGTHAVYGLRQRKEP